MATFANLVIVVSSLSFVLVGVSDRALPSLWGRAQSVLVWIRSR